MTPTPIPLHASPLAQLPPPPAWPVPDFIAVDGFVYELRGRDQQGGLYALLPVNGCPDFLLTPQAELERPGARAYSVFLIAAGGAE